MRLLKTLPRFVRLKIICVYLFIYTLNFMPNHYLQQKLNQTHLTPGHISSCRYLMIKLPKIYFRQILGPRNLNLAYTHIMTLGETWTGFHLATPFFLSMSERKYQKWYLGQTLGHGLGHTLPHHFFANLLCQMKSTLREIMFYTKDAF